MRRRRAEGALPLRPNAADPVARGLQDLHRRRGRSAGAQRRLSGHRTGRIRGADGALGLRQDNVDEHARVPRPPDRGQLLVGGRGGGEDVGRRAGPLAEPEDRLRVSELQFARPDDGPGERGIAALVRPAGPRPATPSAGLAIAAQSGAGIADGPQAVATFRRPTTAGSHRPRAGEQTAYPVGRRAHGKHRLAHQPRGDGLVSAAQRGRRDHDCSGDARSGRGEARALHGRLARRADHLRFDGFCATAAVLHQPEDESP